MYSMVAVLHTVLHTLKLLREYIFKIFITRKQFL